MTFWLFSPIKGSNTVKLLSLGGFLEIRYYSTIMLPWRLIRGGGGLICKNDFLGGCLFEGGIFGAWGLIRGFTV